MRAPYASPALLGPRDLLPAPRAPALRVEAIGQSCEPFLIDIVVFFRGKELPGFNG